MDTPHAAKEILRAPFKDVVPGIDLQTEAESLLEHLLGAVPAGVAVLDRGLRYVYVNQQLAEMHGLAPETHLGRRLQEVVPALASEIEPYLKATLASGRIQRDVDISGETPATGGQPGHWLVSFHPYPASGVPRGVLLTARDVSETRRARLALADSELRARRTLDNLVSFVGTLSPDGTLIDANRKALESAGIGLAEVLGRKFWDCVWWTHDPAEQQRLQEAVASVAAGNIERYDAVVRMAGDSRMAIDFMLAPLRDAGGNITHLIPSAIDITARKNDQALIEGTLAEKTALLNELHHRVKNNLQVISSLLSLQTRHAEPAARAPLEESLGRVQAMALLHEMLYASKRYAAIDLAEYLRQLTQLLRAIAGEGRAGIRIEFDARDADVRLELQRAVPCGLLVNELVTNAVKHAFNGRATGVVRIVLERRDDAWASVTVADDGIGLPPESDLAVSQSLGLQLVPMLVEQLRGEMETERTPCTRFTFRFPTSGNGG